jgi:hypothetical protein
MSEHKDERSPEETSERLDRALRRALQTPPPSPHKPKAHFPQRRPAKKPKGRSAGAT